MDTTIENALKIIANPIITDKRKNYWIKVVKDTANGFRVAKLYSQADLLEKQLRFAVSRRSQL